MVASHAAAQSVSAISGVSVEVSAAGSELVKFRGQGVGQPRKAFTLANPNRVVIDIDRIPSTSLSLPKNYAGKLIKSIRFGQFDPATSRIVLDLAGPATLTKSESPDAAFAVLLTPSGPSTPTPAIEDKPLIVIDAGHGGQDPGALGLHKTHEKDITLSYARHLRKALLATGRYRAKIQVGRISTFGLMELSRQRLRPSISESMGVMCPHCRGTGYIHSVETVGIQIIRTLEKEAATGEYAGLRVTTHPEAALYLLNDKRAALQALELRYNVSVSVLMDASIITGNHRLVKITTDGREIAHDNSKPSQQHARGGRGGARRGRRGGGTGNVINFDQAVITSPEDENYVSDSINPDDDEVIGIAPSEGNVEFAPRGPREPRGDRPRRDRGERGGRGNNRNRNRGDRPDRTPRDPAEVAQAVNGEAHAPAPVQLDENGQPIERSDRNRRRGRRGGRNRSRDGRPRREEGSISNPVTMASDNGPDSVAPTGDYKPRPEHSHHEPAPASYSSAAAEPARPASVIPLSEKQTNPAAIASPIFDQGSTAEKPKRKGWWSKVLEG
jgi:hypothetical protein